jgi:L-arabinose isomerase
MIDKFTYETESFDIKELTKNKKALTKSEISDIIEYIEGRLSYISRHESDKYDHVVDLVNVDIALRKLV